MSRLEDLLASAWISGVVACAVVTLKSVGWTGNQAIEVIFGDGSGRLDRKLVFRDDEHQLENTRAGRPWSFEGDGHLFRPGQWRIKHAEPSRWIDEQPRDGDGGPDGD